MQVFGDCRFHPQLRELVIEASLALARLDADRLEDLALSCQALNRDLAGMGMAKRDVESQAREARADLGFLGRFLEATRANLEVMNRVRERVAGQREYSGR